MNASYPPPAGTPSPRLTPGRLRGWTIVLSALWVGCGMIAPGRTATAEGWRAGVGRVEITPDSPMWMAGYGSRDRPAEGKLTELWCKTLLLEDAAGDRALLITLDLVGIDRDLAGSICERIGELHGLARHQISICTSHTHTGPVVGQNLGPLHYEILTPEQQRLVERYTSRLADAVVAAAGQALEAPQHCRVRYGHGEATFAVNRRENRPEGDVPGRRAAGTLAGPVDHDVPVLAVEDESGEPMAIVFGYACHATVLSSYVWSGDYPGFAQAEIERLYPGTQAMFWAGCGADQNPLPRRTVALAEHYGRRLAAAVEAVLLTSEMEELTPEIETVYAEIDASFDELPSRELLEHQARSDNRFERARAAMLLARIDAGEPLSPTYPYPVGTWKLGRRVHWFFLGGEVVVDYSLRLKQELPDNSWVAGYANDVMAYIPSRRVLREGGYEGGGAMVYYGLPTVWSPAIEGQIIGETLRQAALLGGANPDPSDRPAEPADVR